MCKSCDLMFYTEYDEDADYAVLEGPGIPAEMSEGGICSMNIDISGSIKNESDQQACLVVSIDDEWDVQVPYAIGDQYAKQTNGTHVAKTGIHDIVLFNIGFCPFCGRALAPFDGCE